MSMWCNFTSYGPNFKASTLPKTLKMISLVLAANDQYHVASAYKAQFFGAISTNMNKMAWKD
jgi:hypothetical protein